MIITENDKLVLRELGKRVAECIASDRNIKNIERWKRHNDIKEMGFMVMVDQLSWSEFDNFGKIVPLCENPFLRDLETGLRKNLFMWDNFRTSQTWNSFISFPKAVIDSGIGIEISEETLESATKDVVSHQYEDQLADETALTKLFMPTIKHDRAETARKEEALTDIFGDIVPVKAVGRELNFRVWDKLATFRSITAILMDLIDEPEFMHKTMRLFTDIEISTLKQYEKEDLLNPYNNVCHCSGTYSDSLPSADFDPENVRSQDCWAYGMAQLFSSCSPQMLLEFELNYAKEYYDLVGLVNYGCCEPLHNSIEDILKIKNIRKVSTSPWADPILTAEQLSQKGVIMARKPNPALIAGTIVDESEIRKELRTTIDICNKMNVPCEFILKDLSTVQRDPGRITRWCEIAWEEIERNA